MSTKTEGNYNLEGVVSELPGYMSRRDVLLAAGVLYQPLTVLGISNLFTSGASAASGNTGNGVMGAVTVNPQTAMLGRHILTITGTGATAAFSITKPDGTTGTAGAVGSAYSAHGLGFTLADGATDFIPGDIFYIDVPATVAALGTNTGTGTISGLTVGAGAMPGIYSLTIIEPASNAGTFVVTNPDGDEIGHGTVAVAFSAGGIGFTLADATDFLAGDQLRITVGGGVGTYGAVNLASVNGLDVAVAVLVERIDTTDNIARTGNVLFQTADVLADRLAWPTGFTAGQKTTAIAQLALQKIRVLAIPPTVGV